MTLVLQAVVSVGTLASMRLCGPDGRWWGWHAATANQLLWALAIVVGQLWGLAPMAAALGVVFARNAARAQHDRRPA